MITSARLIIEYMVGMTRDEFLSDSLRHDAVIQRVLLLGRCSSPTETARRATQPHGAHMPAGNGGVDGKSNKSGIPAFSVAEITPELAWDIRRRTVATMLENLEPPLYPRLTVAELEALDAPPVALIVPDKSRYDAFVDYAEGVLRHDGHRYGDFLDLDKQGRRSYFEDKQLRELPPDAPPGFVRQTHLWVVSPNDQLLGIVRFRHHLNDALRLEGGHIGYEVAPAFRRRNVGTIALHRTLVWIRENRPELADVLITCDHDNVGSRKIIERNGGLLCGTGISKRSGKEVFRFVIDL